MTGTENPNIATVRADKRPINSIPFSGLTAMAGLLIAVLGASEFNRVARAGYLYVADEAAGTVYRIDGSGDETVFASGLNFPSALAADGSGDIYVSDQTALYKFTPNGSKSVFSNVRGLMGLAVDSAGDVFGTFWTQFAESSDLLEFSPAGQESELDNRLSEPFELAIDANSSVFVAEYIEGSPTTASIREYELTGFPQHYLGFPFVNGLTGAAGMVFDKAGDLLVSDGYGTISRITTAGTKFTYFSTSTSTALGELAIDPNGDLFVVDGTTFGSEQISEITPSGGFSTIASGFDDPSSIVFVVPEPTSLHLLLLGTIGLFGSAALCKRHLPPRLH